MKASVRSLLPRIPRPHRILSGPLRGHWIVTSWHDYPGAILGYTERRLLEWFACNVRAGETWLDVGAHYGFTSLALSRLVGADGRVFAFEPMMTTAGYIAQTRRLNNLRQLYILPVGLGAPAHGMEWASVPTTRGMADKTVEPGDWNEMILVDGLDRLWSSVCSGTPRIDGIKIDVQGMEIETLRGMYTLVQTHHPKLVVELHTGVDRRAFLELVVELGYTLPGLSIDTPPAHQEETYLDNCSFAFA